MNGTDPVADLDDLQILRVLAEVPAELTERRTIIGDRPASLKEAQAVLRAVIELNADSDTQATTRIPASEDPISVGRAVLRAMLADSDIAADIHDLVTNPPGDDQMSIEQVMGDAAVIAALVSWLQLKIKFKLTRGPGGTKTEIEVSKEALDRKNLGKALEIAKRALRMTNLTPPRSVAGNGYCNGICRRA